MIALILFIAVIGFSLGQRDQVSWPEKFLKDSVSYVQQWFYKPAGYLAGFFQDIREIRIIYKENEQFRMMAAAYARDKINYNFIQQENDRLKEDLKFTKLQRELFQYNYLIAQVVNVSPDANNRSFTINLGSLNGIKRDMAVISIDGLVGIISQVSAFTSTVMPITELDSRSPSSSKAISATVLGNENGSFGIIESYDPKEGELLMTKIDSNDPLKEGDTIITSGLGNVFPRGIVIGTVTSRQVGDMALTYTAHIQPAAKLDHLIEVFVVEVPQIEDSVQEIEDSEEQDAGDTGP